MSHVYLSERNSKAQGAHVCSLLKNYNDSLDAVQMNIREKTNKGEKVIYLFDNHNREDALSKFRPMEKNLRINQLQLLSAARVLHPIGTFTPQNVISRLNEESEKAIEQGFSKLNIYMEATWILDEHIEFALFREFEGLLNDFLATKNCSVFCQYDSQRFSPETVSDILSLHPWIMKDKVKFQNNLYTSFHKHPTLDSRRRKLEQILQVMEENAKLKYEIENSRRVFEHIFEKSSDGLIVLDREGSIKYANIMACKLFGQPSEKLIGSAFGFPAFSGEINELDILRPSGDPGLAEMRVQETIWEDQPAQMVFLSDITERKQAEDEKKALQDRIQQAQKLEVIGTLAGGIAHDFNNILAAMQGYVELASDEIDNPTLAKEDLRHVYLAGKRATDLVKQILTVARKTEKRKSLLHIQNIIEEALKLLRPSISTNITIKTDINRTTPEILADPSEIHQIIMNLCVNANHAMQAIHRENHVLFLSLDSVELDTRNIRLKRLNVDPGSFVRLIVSDTGSGIDEKTREKIFEPYFTTKTKNHEGTGLGLATVHSIVLKLGGAVFVESTPGVMSRFTLYFPVFKGKYEDLNLSEKEKKTILNGNERIMVVDDEELIGNLLKRTLGRHGYDVDIYNDSQKALEAFRNRPENYDLIITDMNMPKLLGVDLAEKCLVLRPELPIFLCSGYSDEPYLKQAKDVGICEILDKPIDMSNLLAKIRHILDEHNKKNDK